jgi:hypothetical protein
MTDTDRKDKCEEILRAIVAKVNSAEGVQFAFEKDWGGDTATLWWAGAHTHIGIPDAPSPDTWEIFLEHLHAQLTRGSGLSWMRGGN